MSCSPPPPLLDLHRVEAFRQTTRVFFDLTLQLPQGQNTVILGPNGAGKTTFLQLLHRDLYAVTKPDSWFRILGQDRWHVRELRSQLGLVSSELQQRYRPRTAVLDVVVSGFSQSLGVPSHIEHSEEQREKAALALKRLGLSRLAGRPFGELWQGEQRRCLLARALIHDPQTLILDEPTANFDLKARFDWVESLRDLLSQGTTAVLVTHRLEEIPPEIDHAILLKGGRVVSSGKTHELFTDQRLSDLFETPVEVTEEKGFFRAVPVHRSSFS